MILKPNFRKAILLVMLLATLLLLAGIVTPQPGKPITKEQLINALSRLRRGDSQTAIVSQVRTRGIDFELTPAVEAELRAAGAGSALIIAARNGLRRQPTPTPSATPKGPPPPSGFWVMIRDSKNPEDVYYYLKKNPDSPYAGKARDRLKELSNIRVQGGLDLVWIPSGTFIMGSEKNADEQPEHRVTISKGFYLGKYEVTQAQWHRAMGTDPSNHKGDDLPVEQVSWDDALAFIAKLNAQNDSYWYMLPSEAQWEYAARAGTVGDYTGDPDPEAWYDRNSEHHTHPVGRKLPNNFELFDMLGNVFEWCEDWYHETYAGAPTDGSAWLSGGEKKYRVLRGGAWANSSAFCRFPNRVKVEPPHAHDTGVGLRILAVVRQ